MAGSFAEKMNNLAIASEFKGLDNENKGKVIDRLQEKMVERMRADFFNLQRLELEVNLSKHTRHTIEALLSVARQKSVSAIGAVAQHLVGAKLLIRHPDIDIDNQGYTSADEQTGRDGDFHINDTVIHVTVSPTEALVTKCQDNIKQGYRPMIITQADRTGMARGLASNRGIEDRISIRSIEDFVAGNVDEMSEYSESHRPSMFKHLFEAYNSRVAKVEPDPSILVKLPDNLTKNSSESD